MPAPNTAKRAVAATFVLTCPLIAGLFVLKPWRPARGTTPVRLTAATRVGAAPQWSDTPLAGNIPYQWYTRDAFLYRRPDRSLAAGGARGKFDPIAGVARSYRAVGGDVESAGRTGPDDWLLSPDRRWLLTYLGGPGRRWAAMTLDGTRRVTFPARFYFQPLVCWKGDSSGWTEVFRGAAGPAAASYNLIPQTPPTPVTPLVSRTEDYSGQPDLLGGIGSDGFVVATWPEDAGRRVVLRIFHSGHAGGEATRLRIDLPRQADLLETEMSPDGRRLAWVFVLPDRGVHGFRLPFFKPRTLETLQQLWVSRLNGAGMRRIAASAPGSKEALTGIHYIRWLPDGKKISFVDHDSIYTVPAD